MLGSDRRLKLPLLSPLGEVTRQALVPLSGLWGERSGGPRPLLSRTPEVKPFIENLLAAPHPYNLPAQVVVGN